MKTPTKKMITIVKYICGVYYPSIDYAKYSELIPVADLNVEPATTHAACSEANGNWLQLHNSGQWKSSATYDLMLSQTHRAKRAGWDVNEHPKSL